MVLFTTPFCLCSFVSKCLLTHRGSPSRGPTIAMKRGCWSRANKALIRDCMPVRLPNWEDGYLHRTNKQVLDTQIYR